MVDTRAASAGVGLAARLPKPAQTDTDAWAVTVSGLWRSFGLRPVLADISLQVRAGETLGVFGANGAGKTTLLRVLSGLLRPQAGTVRVLGAELPKELHRLRGRVGYLGHEPLVYRELTARENLRYHARLQGVGLQRVEEVLEAVQMQRRADQPVAELSRGMVQRLAAARCALADPPLLLLDEPRASLDPAASEALEPLIGRQSRKTRVVCTHDVDAGLAECDRALGLRAGRQEFLGHADAHEIRALYR